MMKIYMCNYFFGASLLATKYKDDFLSFKNRCFPMIDSEIWFYYDGEVNTCYVSCLKFVWQELLYDGFEYFMQSLEAVCIYYRSHFFDERDNEIDYVYTSCIATLDKLTAICNDCVLNSFSPGYARFLLLNIFIHCLKLNKGISFFRRKKWLEYIVLHAILIRMSIL